MPGADSLEVSPGFTLASMLPDPLCTAREFSYVTHISEEKGTGKGDREEVPTIKKQTLNTVALKSPQKLIIDINKQLGACPRMREMTECRIRANTRFAPTKGFRSDVGVNLVFTRYSRTASS